MAIAMFFLTFSLCVLILPYIDAAANLTHWSSNSTGTSSAPLSIPLSNPIPVQTTRFFLYHTTDIHGWVNGHPHEPKLDCDFGDWVSFMEHRRAWAKANNVELFLFDTGDLIEGTGLSDAAPIHGQYIFPPTLNVSYDGMTIGNHDLGHANTVETITDYFAPALGDRYITSNTVLPSQQQTTLSKSYRIVDTDLGHRILVLGYIFNFTLFAPENSLVDDPLYNYQLKYFNEAMNIPNVDLIVTLNHIDPVGQFVELNVQYQAIRASKNHKTTPIIAFSGHSHTYNYFHFNFPGTSQLDPSALTFESGKYFEAVGELQFDLNQRSGALENLSYQWINTTKAIFYEIAGKKSAEEFMTPKGLATRAYIQEKYKELGLSRLLGCSLLEFNLDPNYNSVDSAYYLLFNYVAPQKLFAEEKNGHYTPYLISNTATIRDNLYSGAVTVNDVFSMSPFSDNYYYLVLNGSVISTVVTWVINNIHEYTALPPKHHHKPHKTPHHNGRGLRQSSPAEVQVYLTAPNFVLNEAEFYTVILAGYDFNQFLPYWHQFYPDLNITQSSAQLYSSPSGPISSTQLWTNFISTAPQFSCENPQPFGYPYYANFTKMGAATATASAHWAVYLGLAIAALLGA
jgi:2',3'-cyclic-nucleotide 2'-phosphodiesterase (5'-nucleotidase family)